MTKDHPRILLVEDNEINRLATAALLEGCGYAPEFAEDGGAAIKTILTARIERHAFDLVLMDVQMPECDGYAATHRLRSAGVSAQELPIVALTANAHPQDVSAALQAGMQAHLAKPLEFQKLMDVLERYLPRTAPSPTSTASSNLVERKQPTPAAEKLAQHWQRRRREAVDAVSSALREDRLNGASAAQLAQMLHNVAGTAGMFGEEEFGTRASVLERALKNREPGLRRSELAQSFLQAA